MSKLGGDKSPFPIPSGAPKKKPSRPWKTKANSTVVTSTYVVRRCRLIQASTKVIAQRQIS